MSTRAVRAEIALQNLDPKLPHWKVDKQGRLVPHGAGPGPEPVAAVEDKKPAPVVVKNALVQLEPEVVTETKTEEVEVVEETKVDVETSVEEAPKKKPGKKEKKVVSTDP